MCFLGKHPAVMITDGSESYAVFTHMCNLMQWSSLYNLPNRWASHCWNSFTNHFLTGREEANNIDCIGDNQPYNDVVYKLSTDPDVIEQLQRQYSSWYFSDIESYGSITDLVGLRSHVLIHDLKHVGTDGIGSLLAKMICFVILKDFVTEMVEHKSVGTQDLVLHVLQGRSSGGLLRYHPNALLAG